MKSAALFIAVLAATISSSYATCAYSSGNGHCVYLDISPTCNTCSPDTDILKSFIPATVAVVQYTGACGCVMDIYTPCYTLITSNNLLSDQYNIPCTRTGQELVTSIMNNQPCAGIACDPKPTPDAPTSAPTPDAPTPGTPTSSPTPDAPTPGVPTSAPTPDAPTPSVPTSAPTSNVPTADHQDSRNTASKMGITLLFMIVIYSVIAIF